MLLVWVWSVDYLIMEQGARHECATSWGLQGLLDCLEIFGVVCALFRPVQLLHVLHRHRFRLSYCARLWVYPHACFWCECDLESLIMERGARMPWVCNKLGTLQGLLDIMALEIFGVVFRGCSTFPPVWDYCTSWTCVDFDSTSQDYEYPHQYNGCLEGLGGHYSTAHFCCFCHDCFWCEVWVWPRIFDHGWKGARMVMPWVCNKLWGPQGLLDMASERIFGVTQPCSVFRPVGLLHFLHMSRFRLALLPWEIIEYSYQ